LFCILFPWFMLIGLRNPCREFLKIFLSIAMKYVLSLVPGSGW